MGGLLTRLQEKWREARAKAAAAKEVEFEPMSPTTTDDPDPEMTLIRLDAHITHIAARRRKELERQARVIEAAGSTGYGTRDKGSAATKATRLLYGRAVGTYDKRIIIAESMRVTLNMALDDKEDAAVITNGMHVIRSVVKDSKALEELEAARTEYHDTLRDLTEFTRGINQLASPSESIIGLSDDPAIEDAALEDELAAYGDVEEEEETTPVSRLVPLDRSPAPQPSRNVPAPRKATTATTSGPLKV